MPKGNKKIYYWDTAAFIAWLDGGQGYPAEVISGLDEVAKEVNDNRAVLITCVTTITEILDGNLSDEQRKRLDNLFKRRNVIRINIDQRIAALGSEIRNYYRSRKIKISTPDAQHLATAIIYKADEFHTLDGMGRRGVLRLNGDVAGHPLHIRVPVAVQPSLLAKVGPLPTEEKDVAGRTGDAKPKDARVEPAPTVVQGSSSGPAQDQARAEGEKAEGKKKDA